MTEVASQTPAKPNETAELGFIDRFRIKMCRLLARRTELWAQIRHFGSWFESEAAAIADEKNQSEVFVELGPDGESPSLRIGPRRHDHDLRRYPQLWTFVTSLGLREIHLDARLERNQIEDVMGLLYCRRRAIRAGHSARNGVVGHLASPQGVHAACTQTSIHDHRLTVRYTYCTLGFSRAVHWFERRHGKFHDHRTLFHAAPRYSAVITLVVSAPAMILAAVHGHSLLCVVLCSSAAVLFALTYAFFMVVGSVEYDNEEKAYNLSKAYGRLRTYTEKIQADVERARTVQETFIPAPDKMPFQDSIAWATSFAPAIEVSGDYFDVAPLDDHRAAILFSDVSGHGMAAAFITAVMKTSFQAWLDHKGTLGELAGQMNANLSRLAPLGSFAAAFVAIYDVSARGLVYANCGHQPEPWHIPADEKKSLRALNDARNLLMGVEDQMSITTSCMVLEPGDTILFVSDGIVENPNAEGHLYGTQRFEAFVQSNRSLNPARLVQAIGHEAREYSRGADQSDDRTILAFRVTA